MQELVNAIIERGYRRGLPDAYILGQVSSVKRDYAMVERAHATFTDKRLRDFEDGLLVQDARSRNAA